jgi:TPR repeat protein
MSEETLLAHALDLSRRGHDEAAGRMLTRLAEAGNAEAAAHLGELVSSCGYLDCDEPQQMAVRWFEQAARAGNPRGALRYALELDDPGSGDPDAATPWYDAARKGLEQAAEAGDAASQKLLSDMYFYGWGVPEDKPRAVGLLERAVRGGNLEAKFSLGHWYWDLPDRTEEQRAAAVRLWREAAEGGLMSAQYHLGACYATEADMPIDYEASVRYYRMAVENGNLEALYNLGTMYLHGEGVTKNVPYGLALIVHAGEVGSIGAVHYLMAAYEHGYGGLPVDEAEAAYWKRKYEADTGED